MVKKLFALASVTALAGIVSAVGAAGCSETVVEDSPTDAGSPDTGAKKEAGPPEEEEPEPESCLTKDPIDATKIPYTKALVAAGACTAKEQEDFTKYFKDNSDNGIKVSQWKTSVSEDCAACIFTTADADAWGPIIVSAKDGIETVNRGGCIEIQTGSVECGRAYQQYSECRLQACLAECKTQEEFSACLQDTTAIYQGPCAASVKNAIDTCGDNIDAAETACKNTAYTFDAPIKSQCVTGGSQVDAGDGG